MAPINSVGSGIRTLGTTPLQQAQLNKLSGGVLFANTRTSATGETPSTPSPEVANFYSDLNAFNSNPTRTNVTDKLEMTTGPNGQVDQMLMLS